LWQRLCSDSESVREENLPLHLVLFDGGQEEMNGEDILPEETLQQ